MNKLDLMNMLLKWNLFMYKGFTVSLVMCGVSHMDQHDSHCIDIIA